MTSILPLAFSVPAILGTVSASVVILNSASVEYVQTVKVERLGQFCEQGVVGACEALSRETDGYCASPHAQGGCRYDSLRMDRYES